VKHELFFERKFCSFFNKKLKKSGFYIKKMKVSKIAPEIEQLYIKIRLFG
jgi:hypothetical protein